MSGQASSSGQASGDSPDVDQLSSNSGSSGDEEDTHQALIVRFLPARNPGENGPWLKVEYGNKDVRTISTLDELRHHRLVMERRDGNFTDVEEKVIIESSRSLVRNIRAGKIRVMDESDCVMNIFGSKNAGSKVSGGGGVLWVCDVRVDVLAVDMGSFKRGGVTISKLHCTGYAGRRYANSTFKTRFVTDRWYWLAGDSHAEKKNYSSNDIYNDAERAVDDSWVMRSLVLQSGSLPSGLVGEHLVEGHIVCVRGDTCVLNAPHVGCRRDCKLDFDVIQGGECRCVLHIPKDVTVIPGVTEMSKYGGKEEFLSSVRNPWPAEKQGDRVKVLRRLLKANSLKCLLGWNDLCVSTGVDMETLAMFMLDYAASVGDKSGSYIPWPGKKLWKIPRLPLSVLSSACLYLEECGWITRGGIPLNVKVSKHGPTVEVTFKVDGTSYCGKGIWSHILKMEESSAVRNR